MPKGLSSIQTIIEKIVEFFVNYSFNVIGALIILILGFLVAKWVSKLTKNILEKKNLDITLARFISGVIKLLVIVFAVIIALGKFGITIAPFIAAIGAGAFGLTYAIQGPLSNYGAGIAIIIGRPFKIGDTITVAGVNGVVENIKLGNTTLKDEDGVTITIPNKHIVGEILRNSEKYRIVESSVGISYGDDPEKAISIILNILKDNENIANTPLPQVGVEEFGDSSINISYRYWVETKNYFNVKHMVNLEIYNKLKENNITIPFPQQEVTIKNKNITCSN